MIEKGRSILFNLLKKARANGVKIAFDSNYRPKLYENKEIAKVLHTQAIKHCDIFLPSLDDERLLFGDKLKVKDIIKNSIENGCNEVIIKNGAKSIIFYYNKSKKKFKIKKINDIIDATSAGDSFNGAYLASRLKEKTIIQSIKKGQKLSAKVIMYKGAIIPIRKSK
jgi:2-dehydro-3-deoxygluconokinase